MTRDQIKEKFPHASEAFIRLNASHTPQEKELDEDNEAAQHGAVMGVKKSFDNEALYSAYQMLGNVHDAAKLFGTTGETVRQHLIKSGYKLNRSKWTKEQEQILVYAYSNQNGVDMKELQSRTGKSLAAIHCKAEELGVTSNRGEYIRTDETRKSLSRAHFILGKDPEIKKMRAKNTAAWIKRLGHPKGHSGKKLSDEHKAKMIKGVKAAWKNPLHKFNSQEHRQRLSDMFSKNSSKAKSSSAFSRCKYGKRSDLGEIFFRSSWEANYARILNFWIKHGDILKWEYEPETFWFETIKRGCRSYKPDFKVTKKDGSVEYHEVKGWMYPRAKTALQRMGKYHPEIKIVLIDSVRYKSLASSFKKMLHHWE